MHNFHICKLYARLRLFDMGFNFNNVLVILGWSQSLMSMRKHAFDLTLYCDIMMMLKFALKAAFLKNIVS